MSGERTAIHTDEAPRAIGPYSQAVVAGGFLFSAGQIALDPVAGVLVGAGDVRQEAEQVMKNLAAVLRAADTDFARVVKTTIYLVDMADFAAVNEVYGRYLNPEATPPARSTVAVRSLPRNALVEIDVIAILAH